MSGKASRETGMVTIWAPFANEAAAQDALLAYTQHANCPSAAIIWTDIGGAKLLRPGVADKDGDVPVLIAHAHGPVKPPAAPPHPGLLDNFETAAAKVLAAAEGKISAGWHAANKFIDEHPMAFDGGSVAFDAIAVAGGIFAIATLGVAGVGVVGMVAIGAAATLLIADGVHYGFEVADQKFHVQGAAAKTKAIESSQLYRSVEWVAPLLCLPDLVMNTPKALTESAKLARDAKSADTAVQEGAEATAKAQNRLANYMDKRSADGAKPPLQSTQQRYQRQINAAKRTQASLETKFTKIATEARNSGIGATFARVGIAGTHYGLGTMGLHPPETPDWMQSIGNAVSAGWHDLGTWFTPSTPAYPVMPDANNQVYHATGPATRMGDDPWADMQSYLSIHLAMTRLRPR
jgi:hypothetical protein